MFTINQPNGLHPSLVHANNGKAGCRGFSLGIENLKLRKPLDFVLFNEFLSKIHHICNDQAYIKQYVKEISFQNIF
jgi:hypothetical protein